MKKIITITAVLFCLQGMGQSKKAPKYWYDNAWHLIPNQKLLNIGCDSITSIQDLFYRNTTIGILDTVTLSVIYSKIELFDTLEVRQLDGNYYEYGNGNWTMLDLRDSNSVKGFIQRHPKYKPSKFQTALCYIQLLALYGKNVQKIPINEYLDWKWEVKKLSDRYQELLNESNY